jgi:NhaP-type Na+/H+ or K+/H+ antiporter
VSFESWTTVIGALLLTMALSSALLRRLPISTAALYLGVGCVLGPWGFDVVRVDLTAASPWLERVTELAVVAALFIGGLRLRLPLRDAAWRAANRLASWVMLASGGGCSVWNPRMRCCSGQFSRQPIPCSPAP